MRNQRRRAVTLLECMISVALLMSLAVLSLIGVGQARVVRSNARERVRMLTIAQSELDRLRLSESLAVTEEPVITMPDGVTGVQVEHRVSAHGTGTMQIEVTVSREVAQGLSPVYLATLVPTGDQP